MKKPLETHNHIVGDSWSILLKVAPSFSGVIVVLSGYVVNSIFLHHSDNLCQLFTKVFMWWIIPHRHHSKLNIIYSMVIIRSYYHPLKLAIFSSSEICGNIVNTLKPQKLLHKINLDIQSCTVLLEIVICIHLCLLLGISDFGFTL